MSVDCLKNFSLDDVRKARIDYTSGGTITLEYLPEYLGNRCTVLQADKIRYGDKSTTGSPISSHRGSSIHHDSGSSSSGSPIASPVSYTRDLIGVDSPGLSGGAGAVTPISIKKEESSPMVPRQLARPELLQPRSVMLNAEPAVQQSNLPARKTRFDVKPEDMEVDEKPKIGPSLITNGLSNGLSNGKRKVESEEEEEEAIDPRRIGLGSFVKRIKLETLTTTVTKPPEPKPSLPLAYLTEAKPRPPPLVPRAVVTAAAAPPRKGPQTPPPQSDEEESSEEDERDRRVPAFGPQLPKTNGIAKPAVNGTKTLSRENSSTSLISTTSSSSSYSTAATTGAAGSVSKAGRRRLLSERGEKELKYPIMEKEIASKWGWEGAEWLNGKKRGQGLINRANDCFLNVILQMITHTAPLARYLMERHKSDCKRESHACVACALRQHHLSRTFNVGGPMETRWIGPHLKRIFPSHSFGMQEDAHELLSLLLDAIDPPPGWNRENGNKELPTNKLKPSTPIEQIFGGTLRNQVTCQSCNTPFINYERIRELNVALGRKQDERIPLANLVQDYFKNETITAFACKKCARKTQAVRQTRVLRAPAVLIVQLKRFNAYGGKIRQPIAAEKELDLTKFTYDSAAPDADKGLGGVGGGGKRATYALSGVVEHLGSTVDHGHYIAYCKALDNQCWFKFDDEDVSKLMGYSNNPYLLFYSRKDLQTKPKNGQVNGIAAASTSSTASTSKLIVTNNVIKQLTSNGSNTTNGLAQNGAHTNGVMKPTYGGAQNGTAAPRSNGYAPYQNGGMPKAYSNQNGGGYSNGKFGSNGYGSSKPQWNGGSSQYNNKWSNGNGGSGRPIKTFQQNKQYKWQNRQQI